MGGWGWGECVCVCVSLCVCLYLCIREGVCVCACLYLREVGGVCVCVREVVCVCLCLCLFKRGSACYVCVCGSVTMTLCVCVPLPCHLSVPPSIFPKLAGLKLKQSINQSIFPNHVCGSVVLENSQADETGRLISSLHPNLMAADRCYTCIHGLSNVCVYTRGFGTPTASQHNLFHLEKLCFSCAPEGIRTLDL